MKIEARSPAKINLFLSVGPPELNGYHPIRTIFQAISLSDLVTMERSDTVDHVTSTWPDLPDDNTVTKALRLLREFGDVPPMRIHINKAIPAESGLGGGSSNAAAVLRHINSFSDVEFSSQILHEVAAAVGADVPFFLVGGRAKGEGFGDILTPLPDSEPLHLVVVRPNVSCSTGLAYKALDAVSYPWLDFPTDETFYNDFERVMPCECDDYTEVLQLFGAKHAHLSGSGSAVYGIFESESNVAEACERLATYRDIRFWPCRSLTRAESLG